MLKLCAAFTLLIVAAAIGCGKKASVDLTNVDTKQDATIEEKPAPTNQKNQSPGAIVDPGDKNASTIKQPNIQKPGAQVGAQTH